MDGVKTEQQKLTNGDSAMVDNKTNKENHQEIEDDNKVNKNRAPVDRGWAWIILAGKVI